MQNYLQVGISKILITQWVLGNVFRKMEENGH